MSRPRTCSSRGLIWSTLLGLLVVPGALAQDGRLRPQLLVSLPDACPTPDGMAIDAEGNLVVACPNFADTARPVK